MAAVAEEVVVATSRTISTIFSNNLVFAKCRASVRLWWTTRLATLPMDHPDCASYLPDLVDDCLRLWPRPIWHQPSHHPNSLHRSSVALPSTRPECDPIVIQQEPCHRWQPHLVDRLPVAVLVKRHPPPEDRPSFEPKNTHLPLQVTRERLQYEPAAGVPLISTCQNRPATAVTMTTRVYWPIHPMRIPIVCAHST